MIEEAWTSLPNRFPTVLLDAFIVMPDHLHAIVGLNDEMRLDVSSLPPLGAVMGAFKSLTSNRYMAGVKNGDWPSFDRHFWHINYWEHIIRDDRDLESRRLYIGRNPFRWEEKHGAMPNMIDP